MRIRDQRTPHGNQIGFTLADELIRQVGISNPANSDHRDVDRGFNAFGKMAKDPFGHIIRRMVKVTGGGITG